ncbi:hypothetical protein DMH25_37045 [Streptomyces sp. WAC 01325]|uniref:Uncharacterized protein n=1 Tax=Streptomyces chartreusis TaxID=1969 RepID=A0A7H8TD46_STRCX|nr:MULTISPECIES: hypothetical protein [Streptomyces]MCZ4609350.1 hypothetical protein [Streptomyces sp. Lzd4kr]WCH91716.1 hypothetical protein POD33_06045 [Streptomyces moderatus]MBT1097272.1 hypothetical protein [Streptomyces sp. Tu102]QKZ21411.1 hypothetical protein HUT05_31175 [Streptomyces chartreusis]RSM92471.1 hypothetical protein DMH25_37045 [Streptomyces sp. WAC 01325]
MRNKVMAVSAIAAGIVLATGGAAAADTDTTTVKGGSGFSGSPVVVNDPQQGLAIVNGAVIDGRCIAPWSNGAVLAATIAPNSHYAACNTGKVDQQQKSPYIGGLLF